MDRLWAAWRMPYVESVDDDDECIFCTKPPAQRDEENYILHRGTKTFVILNIFPYNPGHIMVAPYRHVGSFEELSEE